MQNLETLQYEERNGVAIVTNNRPEVYNAFNRLMERELQQVWRSLRMNDDIRAVVWTGAGDKAFCTGIDRDESITEYLADPTGEKRGQERRAACRRRSCSTTLACSSTRSRTTCGSPSSPP